MRFMVAGALVLVLMAGCGTDATDNSSAAADEPNGQGELGCSVDEQTAVDLDVPGPGTATPKEAVDALTDGPTDVVSETADEAMVNAMGPDGRVARVFKVTHREDGWWPESYTECSG